MNEIEAGWRTMGVDFTKNGETRVQIWAPEAQSLEIISGAHKVKMAKDGSGNWIAYTRLLKPFDEYFFLLDGKTQLADPASVSQPKGVHGPSMALDLKNFNWTDGDWKNPQLAEYIFYELHTGCFTPEGNFKSAITRLEHLKDLGINAIEIMPVAQFAGERNWGYDGAFPYAVQHSYGGAAGLQQFVNACHSMNIAVVLDVVYNHLGPEGSCLCEYAPFTTSKYATPWGGAINFDDAWSDGVRKYFIENALMWFRDFHIDALRLDAVHAIKDFGPRHLLSELREKTDELMRLTGKNYYLIAETDLNDDRYINKLSEKGFGMDAQWIDEFHHALRMASGGEPTGYYADFNGVEHLAKAYRDAYVYDGQFSEHRKKKFGTKTSNPGDQFVVFSQNHDQVGNRMLGERPAQLFGFEMQKLMAGAVFVSPFLPMLFMGEEWGETNPFLYFVSHTDPELAEAVRKGRKEEFKAFHNEGEAPDPVDEQSFLDSKLQWELLEIPEHHNLFLYYKALINLRKTHPAIHSNNRNHLKAQTLPEKNLLVLERWHTDETVCCLLNFSKQQQQLELPSSENGWQKIFDSASKQWQGMEEQSEILCGAFFHSAQIEPHSIQIYSKG